MSAFPLPSAAPEDIGLSTAGLARLTRMMHDEIGAGGSPERWR